jgi:O-antigen ligase
VFGAVLVIAQAYGWSAPGIHWEAGMALPAGTSPNRNCAAYPIAAALIIAAFAAGRGPWPRRGAAVAASAVCALGLVLSCARGAWIAAIAAALAVGALSAAATWRQWRAALAARPSPAPSPWRAPLSWRGVGALVLVGGVVFAGTAVRPEAATAEAREQDAKHPTSIAHRLDIATHHESVSTRFDLWRGAFEMARERPLLGGGAAGYLATMDAHAPGGAAHTHAHNEVLYVAAVAGVPAALALLAFLAAVTITIVRRWRRDPATTPLVLVLLLPVALGPPAIEIMTLSPIFGPLCAVLLGAALAGIRRPV